MTNNDIVIIIPGSGATVNLFSQKILLFVNEELSTTSSFMLFVTGTSSYVAYANIFGNAEQKTII